MHTLGHWSIVCYKIVPFKNRYLKAMELDIVNIGRIISLKCAINSPSKNRWDGF